MFTAKYYFCVFIGFSTVLLQVTGLSQTNGDTLKLPEFEIKSNFVVDNQGFKRIRLDSSLLIPNLSADLSTLISRHSTIFIKSYGNGTLATPSFRGTSAQHTQVEWNGISLNSPMLGQMDFSQVPVSQFDGLEILFGAAGISRSSGAFGGIIDLVTSPDWGNTDNFLLGQQVGSFGTLATNVNVATGTPTFQAHLKLNYNSAVNNFPFTRKNGEVVEQKNAAMSQVGISQEMFWRIRDKHLISTRLWYSQNDRNLPPTSETYDSLRSETMHEKAFRGVIEYKYVESAWNLWLRSALNEQFMIYTNNAPSYNSAHYSVSWINRIRFSYTKIKGLIIRPGVDLTYDRVHSDDYKQLMTTRTTTSLFTELSYDFSPKIKSSLVLREDIVDGTFGKLIPAFGIEYRPFNRINLAFSSNLSRNYRYPSLNDQYWKDSGSIELKPEQNYAAEIGSTFNQQWKPGNMFVEASLSAYYSRIYNMITWVPDSTGSGLFSPENVDEILARGFEAGLNVGFDVYEFKCSIKNNYNYCRSTYEKVNSTSDNKLGKQQIYMPINSFNSTVSVERWNFYFNYNISYVSDRYTAKDNETIMPGYSLSNIILGKNININQIILSLQFDINNLFNLDYESVASRPMPGINYLLSVKMAFSGLKR